MVLRGLVEAVASAGGAPFASWGAGSAQRQKAAGDGGMSAGFIRAGVLMALAIGAAAPACSWAAGDPPDRRAAYAAIAALPDLDEGVWNIDWQAPRRPAQPKPQLTPQAQARADAALREGRQNRNANCLPPGMPGVMGWPYPMEFIYSPGRVTIAIESDSQVRRIYTDGRGHPADPDPTFNGDSIGHWEGGDLFIETLALNPTTEIAPGVGHSDQARILERVHRTGPDDLDIVTTVEDPKVLVAPWTTTRHFIRHRDWQIQEYVCEQNNHDSVDAEGRPGFELDQPAPAGR